MKPEAVAIFANGKEEQVELPCSVANFVTGRGLKPTQVVVEYNGQVLERAELTHTMLMAVDSLEVIVAVAGG